MRGDQETRDYYFKRGKVPCCPREKLRRVKNNKSTHTSGENSLKKRERGKGKLQSIPFLP